LLAQGNDGRANSFAAEPLLETDDIITRRGTGGLEASEAVLIALAGPFQPQRRLTLRCLSFALRGLPVLLLFTLPGRFTLGLRQLLTQCDDGRTLLNLAAKFFSACRFGLLHPLSGCCPVHLARGIMFDFAYRDRLGEKGREQRVSPHQRDAEDGNCDRVGSDDADQPRPTLLTFKLQKPVVGRAPLCIAKDLDGRSNLGRVGVRVGTNVVVAVATDSFMENPTIDDSG
jgi:hypothetical protein